VHSTPGARMSMITEDLAPNAEIRVHLHERARTRPSSFGWAAASRRLAISRSRSRLVPIIYVPQGVWHGLRNSGKDVLAMSATYSPPGFEQVFRQRLLRPDRTQAEIEADRARYGIVYRTP
jgi:hypothetical protein